MESEELRLRLEKIEEIVLGNNYILQVLAQVVGVDLEEIKGDQDNRKVNKGGKYSVTAKSEEGEDEG